MCATGISAAFLLLLTTLAEADVSESDVQFALRTRQNPTNQKFVTPFDVSTVSSSKHLKIITHGWTAWGNDTWITNMTKAMLKADDYNIIVVNWHKPADKTYPVSAVNTKDVGEIIGKLVVKLHKQRNVHLNNIHLIGHSLGAHVMGFAGKYVKKTVGSAVQRLTALDAAGPGFETPVLQPTTNRVSKGDGKIVEGVHTDGGVLGFVSPYGDIDFYPNGGLYIQPNCVNKSEPIIEGVYGSVGCSHGKSPQYFTEAWKKGGITATKCSSWKTYKSGSCDGNEKATFASKQPPTEEGKFYFKIVTDLIE